MSTHPEPAPEATGHRVDPAGTRHRIRPRSGRLCRLGIALLPALCVVGATAAPGVADPLGSPQWRWMHQQLLAGAPVVFDERVRVRAPTLVEDALNVPVSVQWSGVGDVREVLVFADLNPIQPILRLHPAGTAEFIGFRFKVEQSTPVRAAVRTGDGTWYLGGRWLSAAGGGCTAPSEARADTGWERQLGEVRARRFDRPGAAGGRLRFQVMHPMDTGLAAGIPEFFLEELTLAGADGRTLARIEPYQPVSANPLFTLDLPDGTSGPLQLRGRDNNGNRVEARIEP